MHDEHPVKLVIWDDGHRSRLTVFFRIILAIPHIIWFLLWTVLSVVLAVVGWLVGLVIGRLPWWLHRFFCSYIRYVAHFGAYLGLVANPYPGFGGAPSSYVVDIELPDEPQPQKRWRIFLRLPLGLPAIMVASAIGGGASFSASSSTGKSGGSTNSGGISSGFITIGSILGWFACVVKGRMPTGLRDLGAYTVGYRAQAMAYVLFVTDRYPFADPTSMLAALPAPPPHPVHIVGDATDLRRSRVTVLFRLPLVIPLVFWLALWTVLAVIALLVQWFATLAMGRPITKLHAFISRYLRFYFHVYAFGSLTANPFPGFTGLPGVYPLDLVLPSPARQNRWKTLFRLFLAIPAFAIESMLGLALFTNAILMWFVALATGKAPEGLRNLSAYCLRYLAQTQAYFWLITDAYPHSSPLEGAEPAPPDEPEPSSYTAAAVEAPAPEPSSEQPAVPADPDEAEPHPDSPA